MRRQAIRVDPLSTYLERRGAPVTPVVRAGDLVYVSDPVLKDWRG